MKKEDSAYSELLNLIDEIHEARIGEAKNALKSITACLGLETVKEWNKKNSESLRNCIVEGGFDSKFKDLKKTVTGYIKEDAEELNYLASLIRLKQGSPDDKRLYKKSIELLKFENYSQYYESLKKTKNTKLRMQKMGINTDEFYAEKSYTSEKLKPYRRTLRGLVFKILGENEEDHAVKSVKKDYAINETNLADKIVDINPEEIEKIALKLKSINAAAQNRDQKDLEDALKELENKDAIEFKIWDRNPKEYLFLGNFAESCIATDQNNFWSVPKFLESASVNKLIISKKAGNKKQKIGYVRLIPCRMDLGGKKKTALFFDCFFLSSKFNADIELIEDLSVSASIEHGKASGFDYLISGGFRLYGCSEYGNLKKCAREELLNELEHDTKLKRFGPKEKILTEDFPERIEYIIHLKE